MFFVVSVSCSSFPRLLTRINWCVPPFDRLLEPFEKLVVVRWVNVVGDSSAVGQQHFHTVACCIHRIGRKEISRPVAIVDVAANGLDYWVHVSRSPAPSARRVMFAAP